MIVDNFATETGGYIAGQANGAGLLQEVLGGTQFSRVADVENLDSVDVALSRLALQPDAAELTRYIFNSRRVGAFVDAAAINAERANGLAIFMRTFGPAYGDLVDDAVALGMSGHHLRVIDDYAAAGLRVDGFLDRNGVPFVNMLSSQSNLITPAAENLNALHRARAGDDVVVLAEKPNAPYRDRDGLTPPRRTADPDYTVNGFFVDAVVAAGEQPGSALTTALEKVQGGQAQRIDIVLDNIGVTIDDIETEFAQNPGFAPENWVSQANPNRGIEGGFSVVTITVLKDGVRSVIFSAAR